MYAIIKTGGKQLRVKEGQLFRVEKLDAESGQVVTFDQVLMLVKDETVSVGSPVLDKASVSAEVISHGRTKKNTIIKLKRRKHHMRRMGYRQSYTQVKITSIKEEAA